MDEKSGRKTISDEIKVQAKSKKTKLIIAIIAVIAVITIVAIVLASSGSATAKKVKEQLSLGEIFLGASIRAGHCRL